jgi:hypothetical protein
MLGTAALPLLIHYNVLYTALYTVLIHYTVLYTVLIRCTLYCTHTLYCTLRCTLQWAIYFHYIGQRHRYPSEMLGRLLGYGNLVIAVFGDSLQHVAVRTHYSCSAHYCYCLQCTLLPAVHTTTCSAHYSCSAHYYLLHTEVLFLSRSSHPFDALSRTSFQWHCLVHPFNCLVHPFNPLLSPAIASRPGR